MLNQQITHQNDTLDMALQLLQTSSIVFAVISLIDVKKPKNRAKWPADVVLAN